MSKFTEKTVDDLADKLLIGLTREENKMVLDEFEIIESNMDIIASIKDISNVEPMSYALDTNATSLREDKYIYANDNDCSIENILRNSDDVEDRSISVPKVVG